MRPYPRLYAAATTARMANEMVPVAVLLHVLERTSSAALAGLTVAAATLPGVVSGPLLGAWLDRARRRRTLLAADQSLAAAGLLALAFAAGRAPDPVIPLIALAAGALSPLSGGGFTSLLPALVPQRMLGRANALEATSFNLAIVAGPALAGVLALGAGTLAAVLAQAGLKLAALVLALRLRDPRAPVPGGRSVLAVARAGVAHLAATPPLLGITLAGALSLGGRGLLTVAFPAFALEALGSGRGLAGFLWAAFAAGSIAGALGAARVSGRSPPEPVALGSAAASGLAILLWPLASAPAPALALVALAGVAYGPGFAATFAVRQRHTPAELQGQVFVTAASLKLGAFALGAAVAAPVVDGVGPAGAFLLAGGAHLLAAAAGWTVLARGGVGVDSVCRRT